jgi:CheY-like chemotaxis protein
VLTGLERIVLVEDDPHDAELTLTALNENNLANEVVQLRDGAEALDYLHQRGAHAGRTNDTPAVALPDWTLAKADGLTVRRTVNAAPPTAARSVL